MASPRRAARSRARRRGRASCAASSTGPARREVDAERLQARPGGHPEQLEPGLDLVDHPLQCGRCAAPSVGDPQPGGGGAGSRGTPSTGRASATQAIQAASAGQLGGQPIAVGGDVGDADPPAGSQDPRHLRGRGRLVGEGAQRALADHRVRTRRRAAGVPRRRRGGSRPGRRGRRPRRRRWRARRWPRTGRRRRRGRRTRRPRAGAVVPMPEATSTSRLPGGEPDAVEQAPGQRRARRGGRSRRAAGRPGRRSSRPRSRP